MIEQAIPATFVFLLQQPPPQLDPAAQERIAKEAIDQFSKALGEGHFGGHAFWLSGVLVPLGLFAMIAVIVWLAFRKSQARMAARAELNRQVLEKFSTGREFSEFLESESGHRFLQDSLSSQANPKERFLRGLRIGILLIVIGLGLFGWGLMYPGRNHHGPSEGGFIVIAVGMGFLISSAVSHHFAKKLGLLSRNAPGPSQGPVSQT